MQAFSLGAQMFLLVKTPCWNSRRREENGTSQMKCGRGWRERRENIFLSPPLPPFPFFALAPTLRVTIFTLPNLPPS